MYQDLNLKQVKEWITEGKINAKLEDGRDVLAVFKLMRNRLKEPKGHMEKHKEAVKNFKIMLSKMAFFKSAVLRPSLPSLRRAVTRRA